MAPVHECMEVVPGADGAVRCPRCDRLTGVTSAELCQWYCRYCRLDLIMKRPAIEAALDSLALQAALTNPGKEQLLAIYLAADLQAAANRARALSLIEQMSNQGSAIDP